MLFLDELPEFGRGAIEVMRQPLEEGTVTISRAIGTFTYPARFQLVASMDPCPCGYRGVRNAECRCDDSAVAKYVGKLSGPLLDRIDLQVQIARVPFDDMVRRDGAEPSATIRERVVSARAFARERFAGTAINANAEIPPSANRTRRPHDRRSRGIGADSRRARRRGSSISKPRAAGRTCRLVR